MTVLQREAISDERVNPLIDMVISDPGLVDLLSRDPSELDDAEAARLRLLGTRLLTVAEANWLDSRAGLAEEERLTRIYRAIWRRPVMNYGAPFAWESFKTRADPGFIQWFEEDVIADLGIIRSPNTPTSAAPRTAP